MIATQLNWEWLMVDSQFWTAGDGRRVWIWASGGRKGSVRRQGGPWSARDVSMRNKANFSVVELA